MNEVTTPDAYGVMIEPATVKMQRLLPGPIERVWDYLTQSELRRQWLASGEMEMKDGASFELTWRNGDLNDPPSQRPEGFSESHSMQSQITQFDPPRKLAISWGGSGDVVFELEPKGDEVLLTLIHNRLPNRNMLLMVGAGWHMHLNILADRMYGRTPQPFWDGWARLKADYDQRLPA